MKLYAIAVLLSILALPAAGQGVHGASQPPAGKAVPFHFPAVHSRTLPNGLRVMIVRKPNVPLLDMQLVVDAGSSRESREKAGLASLTCQMLFTGTQSTPMQDLIGRIDRYDITAWSVANYDYALVSARCLSIYSRQAVDLLADVAMNAQFPPAFLEFYRSQLRLSLEGQLRDPAQTSSLLFYTQLFGPAHPYGRSAGGLLDRLDSLRIEDVRQFYADYYRPNNATLMIAGDADPEALFALIADRFERWENRQVPRPVFPSFPQADSLRILLVQDSLASAAHVRVGNASVRRNAPQFPAAVVMNQIFGGDFLSRLNMALWGERKITPSFRSVLGAHPDVGFFVAAGACPPQRTPETVETLLEEMRGMMTRRPTAAEMAYARRLLLKSYELEFETNAQILRKLMESAVYDVPLERYESYPREIRGVTAEDVEAAAQMFLDPKRATVVVAGNAALFADGLQRLFPGRVRVLDVEQPLDGGKGE